MRVLLDTNVWRYLVDTERHDSLYKVAKQSGVTIVVCPSIIIETLRLSNLALRKKIIEIQTRDCWHRLMPDAYLECEDLKRELMRTHPEWELPEKNISLYRKLRFDWIRSSGGFWSKVRKDTDLIASMYSTKDSSVLEKARDQARQMRTQVINSDGGKLVYKSLSEMTGTWTLSNSEKVKVEFWRVYAQTVWVNMLLDKNSSFRQWLGCDFNLDLMLSSYYESDFLNFWSHDVRAESVPREWLRAAIYCLQSDRKITDGNPTDAAIGIHLVDIDYLVSADKNFVSILNQCRDEASFKTGSACLIGAGIEGIDQLFEFMSDKFIKYRR
jgi:hypothetical protein